MSSPSDRFRIQLFLSARNLKDLDAMSKSDPQAICYVLQNNQWQVIGQTEMVKDNLNPEFATTIKLEYIFEQVQRLKFEVYDIDGSNRELIGSVETQLGKIMGSQKCTQTLDITKGKQKGGQLIIRGDKEIQCPGKLCLKIKGINIYDIRWNPLTRSSPELHFYKQNVFGEWLLVHKTEDHHHNLNPNFKPFQIKMSTICDGDYSRPIKITCQDHRKNGNIDFIAQVVFTMNQLVNANEKKLNLLSSGKQHYGTLVIEDLRICPDFLDYIYQGMQLSLIGAVDFTASNLDPKNPQSLHYINPSGSFNKYQEALDQVSQILINYDSDRLVPMYGFGGVPHFQELNLQTVSHCFPLNGNLQNPYVQDTQGILQTYFNALYQVKLHGPTLFNPLIQMAITTASQSYQKSLQDGSHINYQVLLILTDGEIHDMKETLSSIVRAANSQIPLSIIIIGIGEADFSSMQKLDGENGLYDYSTNQKAKRDIVQFVQMSKALNDLSQQVLAELPYQIEQFMELFNLNKPQ